MSDRPRKERVECQQFQEALEATRAGVVVTPEVLLARVNEATREHSRSCEQCHAAVEEMAVARKELARLWEAQPEPGPWFTAQVMGAIRAKENEIEEKSNGVWVSVRRLAPRLVAFCTLLLVLGGTWALELRRAEQAARQAERRPVEGLFESTPSTPVNDDVMASWHQESRP